MKKLISITLSAIVICVNNFASADQSRDAYSLPNPEQCVVRIDGVTKTTTGGTLLEKKLNCSYRIWTKDTNDHFIQGTASATIVSGESLLRKWGPAVAAAPVAAVAVIGTFPTAIALPISLTVLVGYSGYIKHESEINSSLEEVADKYCDQLGLKLQELRCKN